MISKATKENFTSADQPLLRRRSLQLRAVMFWAAKCWIVVILVALFFSVLGLPLTPFSYYALDVLATLFLVSSMGRAICIAVYMLTGVEARAKDEISFIPPGVTAGILQRLYIGSAIILRELGMSVVASWLLLTTSARAGAWPAAVSGAAMDTLAGLGTVGMLCILVRLVLMHCHAIGWLVIYDPGDKLHRKRAPAETDAQAVSPVALRVLVLTRRAATALLILLAFMAVLMISGRAWFLRWIPKYDEWCLYVSVGVAAAIGLYTIVRLFLIAFVFARYSIAHVLGMQLLIGSLVALTMNLPQGWNLLAFFPAMILVVVCFYYIALQDPDGDAYVPEFVRSQRRERRRLRREEEKKRKESERLEQLTHESAASRRTPPTPLPGAN